MRTPARLFLACLLGVACSDGGPTQPDGEGSILVQISTAGGDVDLDGYILSVDDGVGITVNAISQFSLRLPEGRHQLTLTGVAANCDVSGGASHQVEILPGDALGHRFDVVCYTTGIEIRVNSEGVDLDPNGFNASVGAVAFGSVGPNGVLRATRLVPGLHTVALSGVAPNCHFVGDSLRTIEVTNRVLSPANFQVDCVATAGSIRVFVTAAGEDVDDRFAVTVIGSSLRANVANGTGFLPLVPGGTRSIRLEDVAGNCTVDGGDEQSVEVPMGGSVRETVEATFGVTCTVDRGTVRITTSTTGPVPNTGYEVVAVRYDCSDPFYYYCDTMEVGRSPIPGNGSVSFESRTGIHYVYITGVPANCSVMGGTSSGLLQVTLNAETTHDFAITCTEPTVLRVGVPTTGTNPDDGYRVILWQYYYYGYYPWAFDIGTVAANGVLERIVYPGEYWVELREINGNCAATVPNPTAHFILAQGETRLEEIPVACT